MTDIYEEHVEWAVVGRLRLLLEQPPHEQFNVTQSFALFAPVLCWVMQRIRKPLAKSPSPIDESAQKLYQQLSTQRIAEQPWNIYTRPVPRIDQFDGRSVEIPAPINFDSHSAFRFLKNLRDSVAHGDSRNVKPFHFPASRGSERVLAGFTFSCEEFDDGRNKPATWNGSVTLLEGELRATGVTLARMYCRALRGASAFVDDSFFGQNAAKGTVEIRAPMANAS